MCLKSVYFHLNSWYCNRSFLAFLYTFKCVYMCIHFKWLKGAQCYTWWGYTLHGVNVEHGDVFKAFRGCYQGRVCVPHEEGEKYEKWDMPKWWIQHQAPTVSPLGPLAAIGMLVEGEVLHKTHRRVLAMMNPDFMAVVNKNFHRWPLAVIGGYWNLGACLVHIPSHECNSWDRSDEKKHTVSTYAPPPFHWSGNGGIDWGKG